MKHQPVRHKCVGSLTSSANHVTQSLKMQETGPTVCNPYPRRPQYSPQFF